MKRCFGLSSMFIVLGILLVASSPAFALEDSPLSFGPKLGINISDFRGDDTELAAELMDWKVGFCGGAFLAYAINDWFSVQPELLYSMKGMKLGFLDMSAGFSLDYIEIPVLAMLTVPTRSKFTPNIYIGPSIGFNVRAEAFASGSFFGRDMDEESDIGEAIKSYEIAMVFGGGVKMGLGRGELTFDIRYVLGLTNIFDDESFAEELEVAPDLKNDVISIMVGYAF